MGAWRRLRSSTRRARQNIVYRNVARWFVLECEQRRNIPKGYSNKKETVAKTEPQEPNNAISDGSSLSTDAEGGITSAEPNGEPTVSDGKVTEKENPVQTSIANAEAKTETDPSEAQKKAGNYKKGHVKIDGFDVTIESPKGSVRRGTDADGKQWEQEMHNTYGYIRGTESVDGDHIDVFLSDNPSLGDVFVVDQVNKDGTFDEHKVMYGFASEEDARRMFLRRIGETTNFHSMRAARY